ncbi:PhnA domain-containing protein [Alteromonas confluentis]|uniref:PhnA domain protein n=1 Tax=Alteromonas confluentis TaxID=1656094 RepID=A0A1E7ZH10_9ALTE|nr:alkylphosphonate utilization protein [Alteromonas confluentis]OFC72744.1 PhnA domain protein [Alteromonas confluentis]
MDRAGNTCELCGSKDVVALYEVPFSPDSEADTHIAACQVCRDQLNGEADVDVAHWRCLNDAIWSPTAPVQVIAWRMLNKLKSESWAQDLLDIAYLEDNVREWGEAGLVDLNREPTLDCNGTPLAAGDTVHLVKDLNVKGATFTAKRGTAVRNIGLSDNPLHIEGRVNGTRIVIIAAYTKKS